jgi:glutamate N-acetyltransferase/amino-acid N-acetyltransferase
MAALIPRRDLEHAIPGPFPGDDPRVSTGTAVEVPRGFATYAGNAGVKDGTPDISILAASGSCTADGVLTKSLFAGPSVALSRRHLADGRARAIVTVAKNANVATGPQGEADAAELAALVAAAVGCRDQEVLVASTGVIGRPYPMGKLRSHLDGLARPQGCDMAEVARAMMTTDTFPKLASARAGSAVVTGVAKGSGMIEPDMATMLAYIVTDAAIAREDLAPMFRQAVDATFNCLSIDSDTSTSDSVFVLANGEAGEVPHGQLSTAVRAVCRSLTLQLAADGEGATKVLQVRVTGARDYAQAKKVAKSIVNSPLLKCAVHGADPNWGRVVMAIGKCSDETDIRQEKVKVSFGGWEVYPRLADDEGLAKVAASMAQQMVEVAVSLGTGAEEATVWGCDLSADYVHINADYTT